MIQTKGANASLSSLLTLLLLLGGRALASLGLLLCCLRLEASDLSQKPPDVLRRDDRLV